MEVAQTRALPFSPAEQLQRKLAQLHEELEMQVRDIMVLVDQDINDSISHGCAAAMIAFPKDGYEVGNVDYLHLGKFQVLDKPAARKLLRAEMSARKLKFSLCASYTISYCGEPAVNTGYVLRLNWKKDWSACCCCPSCYDCCDDGGCIECCTSQPWTFTCCFW